MLEAFGAANVAIGGTGHFVLVAIAALVAAFASAGLTAAAVRRRDGQTALLGTAFSTMTAMLAVHGLATPGVLVGPNGVVALAGGLSLPAGAAVLALTALPACATRGGWARCSRSRPRSRWASSRSAPPGCCGRRTSRPSRRPAAARALAL